MLCKINNACIVMSYRLLNVTFIVDWEEMLTCHIVGKLRPIVGRNADLPTLEHYSGVADEYVRTIKPPYIEDKWGRDKKHQKVRCKESCVVAVMYVATRFVLAWDISPTKDKYNAISLLRAARYTAGDIPRLFITDGIHQYRIAFKKVFRTLKGIRSIHIRDIHIRNLICNAIQTSRSASTGGSRTASGISAALTRVLAGGTHNQTINIPTTILLTVRLFCSKCKYSVRGKDWGEADKKFANHCEKTGHYRLDLSCMSCDYTARHSWPDVRLDAFDAHTKETGHKHVKIVCPDCGLSMEGNSFAKLYPQYEEHGHETAHDSYIVGR